MGKLIKDMTDDEIEAAIEELRAVPLPAAPKGPRGPKRIDDPSHTKRRKGLIDQLED
jgi:hypothetical protein